MTSRLLTAGGLSLLALSIVGCSHTEWTAKGQFTGIAGYTSTLRADGLPMTVTTMHIEKGPSLAGPLDQPPRPTSGLDVVLADAKDRALAPRDLQAGDKIRVRGRMPASELHDHGMHQLQIPANYQVLTLAPDERPQKIKSAATKPDVKPDAKS